MTETIVSGKMPVLALRGLTVFPDQTVHFDVGRPKSVLALEAIAAKAVERQIGARGLRAIMEGTMTKIMFQIPSDLTIRKVIITADCVNGGEPTIVRDAEHPRQKLGAK